MTQLTRKNIKLFAGNSASNQTGKVGTYKLGSAGVVFSKDPAVIQAGEWENGMVNTLQSDYAPFLEEYNSIIYCMCYFLKQLSQTGIMQYDASEEYYVGSYAISTVDGYLYRSLQGTSGTPNTNHEPSASPTYWELQDFTQKVNLTGDNATFTALPTATKQTLRNLFKPDLTAGVAKSTAVTGWTATEDGKVYVTKNNIINTNPMQVYIDGIIVHSYETFNLTDNDTSSTWFDVFKGQVITYGTSVLSCTFYPFLGN